LKLVKEVSMLTDICWSSLCGNQFYAAWSWNFMSIVCHGKYICFFGHPWSKVLHYMHLFQHQIT